MLTKVANAFLNNASIAGKATLAPLGIGFAAMDVGSGQASVPQALGGSLGGFMGFEGGKNLTKNLFSKIPKVGKWGRLGSVTGFVGGIAGSIPAFMAGRKAGELVPGFKHKQLT